MLDDELYHQHGDMNSAELFSWLYLHLCLVFVPSVVECDETRRMLLFFPWCFGSFCSETCNKVTFCGEAIPLLFPLSVKPTSLIIMSAELSLVFTSCTWEQNVKQILNLWVEAMSTKNLFKIQKWKKTCSSNPLPTAHKSQVPILHQKEHLGSDKSATQYKTISSAPPESKDGW